jgi:hypothetical protein
MKLQRVINTPLTLKATKADLYKEYITQYQQQRILFMLLAVLVVLLLLR